MRATSAATTVASTGVARAASPWARAASPSPQGSTIAAASVAGPGSKPGAPRAGRRRRAASPAGPWRRVAGGFGREHGGCPFRGCGCQRSPPSHARRRASQRTGAPRRWAGRRACPAGRARARRPVRIAAPRPRQGSLVGGAELIDSDAAAGSARPGGSTSAWPRPPPPGPRPAAGAGRWSAGRPPGRC